MARASPAEIANMDRRTDSLGLFNFAESYFICGKTLSIQSIRGLLFSNPIEYLLYHSIELYLKSFLRNNGLGTYEISTTYGHNLSKLLDKASSLGLLIDQIDSDRINHLHDQNLVLEARYITTGLKQSFPLEIILQTAERVRGAVLNSLVATGIPVRPEPFYSDVKFDTAHRTFPDTSDDG